MAINFPTSLDNFTNPSSGNTLDSPSHSLQHSDINDAVEAMQRKVGVGTAVAGSASAGQVLTISAAGTSTWSAVPNTSALTQIVPTSVAVGSGSGSFDSNGRVTFSGASTLSLNGIFTSTYKNYFLVLENITFTAGSTFGARLRLAGADSSGANYKYGVERRVIATNTATPYTNNGDTQFSIGDPNNASFYVDFINPQDSKVTWYRFYQFANYSNFTGSGFFDLTTQFDGVTFFPSAGTITGNIQVYGYR